MEVAWRHKKTGLNVCRDVTLKAEQHKQEIWHYVTINEYKKHHFKCLLVLVLKLILSSQISFFSPSISAQQEKKEKMYVSR